MIGTIDENTRKVREIMPYKYMLTWERKECPQLMEHCKYYGHYEFDSIADALQMAYCCGYVNGHIATMNGEYKEESKDTEEQTRPRRARTGTKEHRP